MASSIVVTGNLVAKPELRELGSGKSVCNIRVASKEYKDTEFVSATLWGPQAEFAAKYLDKGQYVAVFGSWKTEKWEKDGEERSKVIIGNARIEPGGRGGDNSNSNSDSGYSSNDGDMPF